MNSSLINKIQKANRYAQQPERVTFTQFSATFQGDNGDHTVSYDHGTWTCTCHFFHAWNVCCHSMALQKMLGTMLPADQASQTILEELHTPELVIVGS